MSRPRDGHLRCGLALMVVLAAACSSGPSASSSGGASGSGGATASGGTTSSGGATATGGAPGSGGVTASGGASAGTGGTTGTGGMDATSGSCDAAPTPRRTAGTIAEFPFDLVYNRQGFIYGDANAVPGGTVVPLNVRFFVSDVMLLRAGAEPPLPVDIVTEAGVPQPYGVHFFNAEDPSSRVMRVLAPPGAYTGITFLLGLADVCNSPIAAGRVAPLSDASQMSWGPPFGYLFLRYEGRNSPSNVPGVPSMIHMGGYPRVLFAPRMRVDGALSIPEGGPGSFSKSMQLAMDQVFLASTTDTTATTGVLPPGEAAAVGDHLFANAGKFQLFVFGP